jgi:adenylate cyclase
VTDELKGGVTLFADLAGSTALYETLGDVAASHAVRSQLEQISSRIRDSDGKVVKTIGDAVHAWLPTADAAASAALSIQRTCHGALPVRVGFHYGEAVHDEQADIFGDTVNIAARLAATARPGEILTSSETVSRLSPGSRALMRDVGPERLKGKAQAMQLFQLLWEENESAVTRAFRTGGANPGRQFLSELAVLKLSYGRRKMTLTRIAMPYTFGRDRGSSLRVDADRVSRDHAHVEFRHGKFVLVDHSTNGTFVTPQGGSEVWLQRESMPLLGNGIISLGGSALQHREVSIEYLIEQ